MNQGIGTTAQPSLRNSSHLRDPPAPRLFAFCSVRQVDSIVIHVNCLPPPAPLLFLTTVPVYIVISHTSPNFGLLHGFLSAD